MLLEFVDLAAKLAVFPINPIDRFTNNTMLLEFFALENEGFSRDSKMDMSDAPGRSIEGNATKVNDLRSDEPLRGKKSSRAWPIVVAGVITLTFGMVLHLSFKRTAVLTIGAMLTSCAILFWWQAVLGWLAHSATQSHYALVRWLGYGGNRLESWCCQPHGTRTRLWTIASFLFVAILGLTLSWFSPTHFWVGMSVSALCVGILFTYVQKKCCRPRGMMATVCSAVGIVFVSMFTNCAVNIPDRDQIPQMLLAASQRMDSKLDRALAVLERLDSQRMLQPGGKVAPISNEDSAILDDAKTAADALTSYRIAVAQGNVQQAILLKPKVEELLEQKYADDRFRFLLTSGDLEVLKGQLNQGIMYYRQALSMRPTDIAALNRLGVTLWSGETSTNYGESVREALQVLKTAHEICQRSHPVNLSNLAMISSNLGLVLMTLGNPNEAEPFFRDSMESWRQIHAADHPTVALSLHNLAFCLAHSCRWADAERINRQALEMRKRIYQSDHPGIAHSLNNLGDCLYFQHKLQDAMLTARAALDMRKRVFPAGHRAIAESASNVGKLLVEMGRTSEAEPLIQESVDICKRLYPGGHPDLVRSLGELVRLRNNQGRFTESEKFARECLDISRAIFAGPHPDTAMCLVHLAVVALNRNQVADAERYAAESLDMTRSLLRQRSPTYTQAIEIQWTCMHHLGRLDEVESSVREALVERSQQFGANSIEVAMCHLQLGRTFAKREQYRDADTMFREAIVCLKSIYNGYHPTIANTLNEHGQVLEALQQFPQAEILHKESLAMRRHNYERDTIGLAASSMYLGQFYKKVNRWNDADAAFTECVELTRSYCNGQNVTLARSLAELSSVRLRLGMVTDAETLAREAHSLFSELFPGDCADKAGSINNLALILVAKGQSAEANQLFLEGIAMCRRLTKADNWDLAMLLGNYSRFLIRRGLTGEARPLIGEAVAMTQRLFGIRDPRCISLLELKRELDDSK